MGVKVLRQSSQGECGLMALLMMCDGLGVEHDVSEVREKYEIGARGASLDTLTRIAEELGVRTRAVRFDLCDLKDLRLPAVIHWGMDHFVTLTKVGKGWVEVLDPAVGRRKVGMAEANKRITGVAMMAEGVIEKRTAASKKQSSGERGWSWVLRMTMRRLPALLMVAFAVEVLALCVPQVGQIMIDGVISANSDDLALTVIVGFGLISVISAVLMVARQNIMLANNIEGKMVLGGEMAKRMLNAPLRWSEGKSSGEILNRFAAMSQVQQAASTAVMSSLLDGVVSVFAIALMFAISPGLAAVSLSCLLVCVAIRAKAMGMMREEGCERLIAQGKEQSYLIETVRGLQSIKLTGCERFRLKRLKELMASRLNSEGRMASTTAKTDAIASGLMGIENVVIYGLGSMSVLQAGAVTGGSWIEVMGVGSIGGLIAFVAYKQMVTTRLNQFAAALVQLSGLRHGLEQAGEILKLEEEKVIDGEGLGLEGEDGLSVEFKNVWFRHGPNEPWILKEVNFKIEGGKTMVIIGASGSGKSTIAKLMLGILKPTRGQIVIGGVDVESGRGDALKGAISAVLQDDQLFGATVKENVTMGDKGLAEEVQRACEMSGIHEEIAKMPMGYRTRVGEGGAGISGGQKQRLFIARALVRKPKLLVLDEATSALDRQTELKVLESVMKGSRTKVFVTHNPKGIEKGAVVVGVVNGFAKVLEMASKDEKAEAA